MRTKILLVFFVAYSIKLVAQQPIASYQPLKWKYENKLYPEEKVYDYIFGTILRKFETLVPSGPRDGYKQLNIFYTNEDHPYTQYYNPAIGEYNIYLHIRNGLWAKTIYQFAHELMHVYIGCKKNELTTWLEESLCELSSMYILEYLNKEFQESPPTQNLYNYTDKDYLLEYKKDNQQDDFKAMGVNTSTDIDTFLITNLNKLDQSENRPFNGLIAFELFPLFYTESPYWKLIPFIYYTSYVSQKPNFENATVILNRESLMFPSKKQQNDTIILLLKNIEDKLFH